MSRRWLLSLLCLSASVVFVQLSSANSALLVNESATRFLIQDQTTVSLEVVNPTKQDLPVRLKLDLLDPHDVSRGFAVSQVTLVPGLNKLSTPLTLRTGSVADDEELPWYRVSYRIDPAAETNPPPAVSGVISLSEIDTPDIFALEVSAPSRTQRGSRHATHVRAFHPITAKPVKGVNVRVELELDDDDEKPQTGTGVTNADGYVLVSIAIPAKLSSSDGEVKVIAKHGGYAKEVRGDLEFSDGARIMVTTDKPIYQPGQLLHVRTLVFDPANHAAANASATLKLIDPESTTVFQTQLTTSRFGVASADWPIPENTRLGDYGIRVELDDESYEGSGFQSIKISRYDLPNFTVNVRPDRAYYLPGQNAAVDVRAVYLFGQAVKRGHVRVVREEERRWNFREQKWDIEAVETYEGETDSDGRFITNLDLKKHHEQLADEDYSRFTDLHYAAYFTDPTTNRTEQRRFDLRVTKDAIHIYVAEGAHRQQARDFPLQFFVATSYADGTPAPCEVAISLFREGTGETYHPGPALKTIRTNRYGLAKLTDLILPKSKSGDDSPSLSFTAVDSGGKVGHHSESFYYREYPVIRVETDKSLYRPGEMIRATITASQAELNLIVDVRSESNIIESRQVRLHNGTTTFTLRYHPEFQNEVTISAYARIPNAYDNDIPFGSRTVLFPHDRDLKLNFRLDHADYKPGEDAIVDFHVSTPDGRPANSALGVVIFDRAVEERARTDQEFNGRFGFSDSYSQWRGYDNQVGGITLKELERIDLTKPLPEGLDLVAELLLGTAAQRPEFFGTDDFETDQAEVFATLTSLQVKPIDEFLSARYRNGGIYPTNGSSLRRLLFEGGTNFDEIRDPWGTAYREAFSIKGDANVFDIMSAGPDKQFATKDDFVVSQITTPYFRFTGEAIDRAVERFHNRTGGFIRDAATLKTELQSEGISFDLLRDPWGQPYQLSFTTHQDRFNVIVTSSGPNKRFEPDAEPKSDDITVWTASIDYMRETTQRMEKALGEFVLRGDGFPDDDGKLERAFAAIEADRLQDPWGHRYYGIYGRASFSLNRAVVQSFAVYGQPANARTEVSPVTQQISSVQLRSLGEDGKKGTADDFNVATFSGVTSEFPENALAPVKQVFSPGPKGAIQGTITDPAEGAIANAKVSANLKNSTLTFETQSDDQGRFILHNLPVGFYQVQCDASNFKKAVVTEVPVSSSKITTLNFRLEPGSISEAVTVTAEAPSIDMSSSKVSTIKEGRMRVSVGQPLQLTTPRLREYFPETLVWQPSLETDQQGRAQLKFKLADNITTWKMSVIGSTEDGEIGTAEADIKAFQPFFMEHDPPRVLTQGDQISLPIVLRNYLERPQTVDLEIKPESWFTLRGPARQSANVAAGDAARPTFELQAVASVKDGKQRITARSSEASDAIEKPVTVHPDGEERTQTTSGLLGNADALDLSLPASAIPGSMQVELKLYPSLMTHVIEGLEGILERPHGCGEQTISSTYPSLLVLRHHKRRGIDSAVTRKAQRFVEFGYQRLLNYRTDEGGFSYWGHGEADLALTTYALRFLHEAAEVVPVDQSIVKETRQWLIKRQSADGSWPASDYSSRQIGNNQTAMLTAFVARVLGMTAAPATAENRSAGEQRKPNASPELQRALSYLATHLNEVNESYVIASYALAALSVGDSKGATHAVDKLRALAHQEGDLTFWPMETSTPFHGWGVAGRVETTALAIQALTETAKAQGSPDSNPTDSLVRSGLLYLLKQKDGYGVWYSTQATVNVLDTFIGLLAPTSQNQNGVAQVIVNGQLATSLNLPAGDQNAALIRADLSRFVQPGVNHIELRRTNNAGLASVQLVARYYEPWSSPRTTPGENSGEAGSLRLSAKFDKTSTMVNEEVVCQVKAERSGTHGYGMMLAEIGLPPGAEVDRASLDNAIKSSGSAINQYDILPDRVVVYLWPRASGVGFSFKFRPRFAMTAKTAASVVYDYYNPEARAVVEPTRFVVR